MDRKAKDGAQKPMVLSKQIDLTSGNPRISTPRINLMEELQRFDAQNKAISTPTAEVIKVEEPEPAQVPRPVVKERPNILGKRRYRNARSSSTDSESSQPATTSSQPATPSRTLSIFNKDVTRSMSKEAVSAATLISGLAHSADSKYCKPDSGAFKIRKRDAVEDVMPGDAVLTIPNPSYVRKPTQPTTGKNTRRTRVIVSEQTKTALTSACPIVISESDTSSIVPVVSGSDSIVKQAVKAPLVTDPTQMPVMVPVSTNQAFAASPDDVVLPAGDGYVVFKAMGNLPKDCNYSISEKSGLVNAVVDQDIFNPQTKLTQAIDAVKRLPVSSIGGTGVIMSASASLLSRSSSNSLLKNTPPVFKQPFPIPGSLQFRGKATPLGMGSRPRHVLIREEEKITTVPLPDPQIASQYAPDKKPILIPKYSQDKKKISVYKVYPNQNEEQQKTASTALVSTSQQASPINAGMQAQYVLPQSIKTPVIEPQFIQAQVLHPRSQRPLQIVSRVHTKQNTITTPATSTVLSTITGIPRPAATTRVLVQPGTIENIGKQLSQHMASDAITNSLVGISSIVPTSIEGNVASQGNPTAQDSKTVKKVVMPRIVHTATAGRQVILPTTTSKAGQQTIVKRIKIEKPSRFTVRQAPIKTQPRKAVTGNKQYVKVDAKYRHILLNQPKVVIKRLKEVKHPISTASSAPRPCGPIIRNVNYPHAGPSNTDGSGTKMKSIIQMSHLKLMKVLKEATSSMCSDSKDLVIPASTASSIPVDDDPDDVLQNEHVLPLVDDDVMLPEVDETEDNVDDELPVIHDVSPTVDGDDVLPIADYDTQ